MSFFNKIIVSIVQLMPKALVGFFSKRYIAGETLESAIRTVKDLNSKNIFATIDVLGESIKNKKEAVQSKEAVLKVFDAVVRNNLKANVSIKPTQMGLGIDENFAFEIVSELVEKAEGLNNFLRIDMEDSPYTDATFRLYRKLRGKYDKVGVVVQAYLKRTFDDVILLNKLDANYRLCKGIYIEPANIAYKDKHVIRNNFVKLLEAMLKSGSYVGIATHDEFLIKEAYRLIRELEIPKDRFEFQMLLGVREDLRDKINSDGYKIRIYVPFGIDWYAYSIRRLKENPNIAGQIFMNIFKFRR